MDSLPKKQSETWTTQIGVILAVTGSAVGLGNFLRFPGLAAKYHGGVFMIPYFIAFLLLGLPLAWAEWATGRYGGVRGHHSAPGIYRTISRGNISSAFGVLGLLVPVGIYMYYVFIEAWCLGYAWYMLTGQLNLGPDKTQYLDFFNRFVGADNDGSLLSTQGIGTLIFLGMCIGMNLYLVYHGITKGIEWFCRMAMPALVICGLIVLARVLTLGTPDPDKPDLNIINGLGFMWNPHTEQMGFFESLANPQMWMEAAGQIFFTLGVGFGIIINYSSYLRQKDDVALSSLTSCAGNEFCEVALGGLITIPAAFVFLGAAGASETASSTFNLGFKTLPMIFQYMPLGQIAGTIFFFLLFLAAITSSVAMIQPAVALLEEGLGLKRRGAVAVLGLLTVAGTGFVVFFSRDLLALNTIDFWIGTFCIYILATFQAILFGWVLGIERGMEELHTGADIRVPKIFGFIIKYVSPLYLLTIFALWLYQQITAKSENQFQAITTNRVVLFSVIFIALLGLFWAVLVCSSVRRWSKAEQVEEERKNRDCPDPPVADGTAPFKPTENMP
jgi:neurotransmitter:Na+ symporter, NSS family